MIPQRTSIPTLPAWDPVAPAWRPTQRTTNSKAVLQAPLQPLQQLCWKSSGMTNDCRSHAAPGGAMLKHGVEGDEQFAHTRDKGHLLRLTRGQ